MKLAISFFVPGMAFTGNTLQEKSLGGSETAALCMARELAKLGNEVYMFCNGEPGYYDGVHYHPVSRFRDVMRTTPHDVCIVQRTPEMFSVKTEAKLNILWQHDLARARFSDEFRGILWNVDQVAVLSDFMLDQYVEAYQSPPEAFWKTRNGVDLSLFPPAKELADRDRKHIFYCARPERGLDVLLDRIMPKLLAADPDITLYLARYDHTTEQMAPFYQALEQKAAQFGKNVVVLGSLTKPELYQEYTRAGVYVYPTPSPVMDDFAEVSCISMMECMAAGLPVVTSDRGALGETLHPDAGTLISGEPVSEEYVDEFVEAVLSFIRDDKKWEKAHQAGLAHSKNLDWSIVAAEWQANFENQITNKSTENLGRLARHFYRRSDVIAALRVLEESGLGDSPLYGQIVDKYPFIFDPEAYEDHYLRHVKTLTQNDINFVAQLPRVRILRDMLKANPQITRILDFGCENASIVTHLANCFSDRHFTGVDLAPIDSEVAYGLAKHKNLTIKTGNEHSFDGEEFDAVMACEILEHSPAPWELAEAVEARAKKDGLVMVTVPYGPWEWDLNQKREHLWEFDAHDLKEMFGHKPGFGMSYIFDHFHETTKDALGFHVLWYRADHEAIPEIDMDRKMRNQSPRHTLAINMVAGPGSDETIRWAVKSMIPLADEIVITDCGMEMDSRAWVQNAFANVGPVTFVPHESPLATGFDAARNAALDATSDNIDFIFWYDTDEKVLRIQNLNKYLRANVFNGYPIPQHHFTIDANFKPDMPCRLFRKSAGLRFIGCIHEHPELGMNEGPGPVVAIGDSNIAHVGYLVEDTRRARFSRNLPMLQMDIKKHPDRIIQKHFICRDNIIMCNYIMEKNGGVVNNDVRELAQDTIRLYREHFMGKERFFNVDTSQYYSEALKLLGIGFDVAFALEADRGTGKLNGSAVRYASKDELLQDLEKTVDYKVERFTNKWW